VGQIETWCFTRAKSGSSLSSVGEEGHPANGKEKNAI